MAIYHASANQYSASHMAQLMRNMNRIAGEQTTLRQQVHAASEELADLIGYESESWEAFWAGISENEPNATILVKLNEEINHVVDARNDAADRQMYAELRSGG